MSFPLEQEGNRVTALIKNSAWFPYAKNVSIKSPYKSGNLRDHATAGQMYYDNVYRIHFSGTIAPYVEYLEEGTSPHDIPGAFGRKLPFGIGGRFDGKFHPGSTKHKGFISVKSVNAIVEYIALKYNGVVTIA